MALLKATREQTQYSQCHLAQLSKGSAMPVKSTTKLGGTRNNRNSLNKMLKSKIWTLALLCYMSLHLEKAKAQGKFWKLRSQQKFRSDSVLPTKWPIFNLYLLD